MGIKATPIVRSPREHSKDYLGFPEKYFYQPEEAIFFGSLNTSGKDVQ